MTDIPKAIIIEYSFVGEEPNEEDRKGVQIEVSVHKGISEEEASQVLVKAYQTIASRVLQKHIIQGCKGCPACEMNAEALRGIDKAYSV